MVVDEKMDVLHVAIQGYGLSNSHDCIVCVLDHLILQTYYDPLNKKSTMVMRRLPRSPITRWPPLLGAVYISSI